MNNTRSKVMLLVDADNVSADVIGQAVERVMDEHGAIHVRRAYCTAETALAQQALFKTLSIRPIVNLSSGKNANDIALAIDAMDLAVTQQIDVAVIVSSDSDFAPLVIRLREKGCRVEGIGQLGKTADDSKRVYDAFIDLQHKKRRSGPAEEADAAAVTRRRAPTRRKPAASAPVPAPAPAPEPVTTPAAERAPSKRRRRR